MNSKDVLDEVAEIINLLLDTDEWKTQHESKEGGAIEIATMRLSMLHFNFYHHYLGGKIE